MKELNDAVLFLLNQFLVGEPVSDETKAIVAEAKAHVEALSPKAPEEASPAVQSGSAIAPVGAVVPVVAPPIPRIA